MFYYRYYREIFWISLIVCLFLDVLLHVLFHTLSLDLYLVTSFMLVGGPFLVWGFLNSDGWRSEYRTCYEKCGQCNHRKYCPHSNVNKIKM